jgi:CubicO group peptidase (beta-lactamase class C family)
VDLGADRHHLILATLVERRIVSDQNEVAVHGEVAGGYEPVAEAFRENFASRGEVGAAFCLYVAGSKVVDIWGGLADRGRRIPWKEDTLTLVFSTTKGATAICAHLLAQRGELDLDAPVSQYWPEFAASGKEAATVRHLLSHRAGLPTLDTAMTPEDALAWDPPVQALAAQSPAWEPGSRHGYHAVTFGWLVGEVIRRVSGRSPGRFLAEEVAGPLGLDMWVGLPEAEEARVSKLIPAGMVAPDPAYLASMPPAQAERFRAMTSPASLTMRALNPTTPPFSFNSRAVHAGELPAANAIATARSLAKLYAATVGEVDGRRILSDDTVASATAVCCEGPDDVLIVDTRFGSGFMLPTAASPLLGDCSFGHSGAGGSLAFADSRAGVGFAYVMNQMQQNLAGDPRPAALVEAVRSCL